MPFTPGLPPTPSRDAGHHSLLFDRRRRGHLAILSALLVVTAFGYLLLQPRTVRVVADGSEVTLQTHMSKDSAVLHGAGVDLREGDRVTVLEAEDGADVLRVERARDVVLHVDGSTYHLRTHAETIAQMLDEAGVAVTGRDSVLQDGALVSVSAPVIRPVVGGARPLNLAEAGARIEIAVRRAVPYTVVRDGQETESTSSLQTVAQALREAGVRLGPGDRVIPDLSAELVRGERIEVRTARAMTVTLPGDHQVLYTFAATVGEALGDAGITLPQGAFIDPSAETAITSDMTVRVVQLSASSDIEREYLESGTVYRTDPALGPGETRTERGHDGVRVRRYDVAYVDGEESGRTLVEDYLETEPADTVVYYPEKSGSDDAAPVGDAAVIRVYATWYNPASSGRSADDPAYGRTATGVQVTYGIVAVDPDVIPLGTRMFIPGYGYAIAADTGGAVKGYIIDLGYPDGVSVDWQSRWLEIYILS